MAKRRAERISGPHRMTRRRAALRAGSALTLILDSPGADPSRTSIPSVPRSAIVAWWSVTAGTRARRSRLPRPSAAVAARRADGQGGAPCSRAPRCARSRRVAARRRRSAHGRLGQGGRRAGGLWRPARACRRPSRALRLSLLRRMAEPGKRGERRHCRRQAPTSTGRRFRSHSARLAARCVEATGRTSGRRAIVRLRELTGERRSFAELKEQAAYVINEMAALRALADLLPIPLWRRNRAGRLTWVNAAYARAVEVENAEAVAGLRDRAVADPHARGDSRGEPARAVLRRGCLGGRRRRRGGSSECSTCRSMTERSAALSTSRRSKACVCNCSRRRNPTPASSTG